MPGRLICAAALLLVGLTPLAAQTPATATVRGRVTNVNGVPLRGAEVRVRDPNGRDNRLATTDEDGRYEVANLSPGAWSVSAAKGGYLRQSYGQRGAFSAPQTLTLAARQRADVNFVLRRGGAVAGRLFDEYGDPVAGARVQLLRTRYTRGKRTFAPAGVEDQTDDTGAFRVYAVPPGDYYVGALLRATGAGDFVEATVGAPTYYPGTGSLGDAQRLHLGPGEELAGISFAIQPVRPVTVSGVVVSASGAPGADTSVQLLAETGDFSVVSTVQGNFGRTGANGAFTMLNVAPGSYLLRARMGVFDPSAGPGEEALMPLVVGPEGVSGLTVTTSRTSPVTVTFVADNGASLANTSLGAGLREPGSGGEFKNSQRTSAGASPVPLRLPGMLGSLALTVDAPRGWMVKQVELDGRDVTDRMFELRGPAPSIRVTLTDRLTRVTGTVRADGRAAAGATVVLFPAEAERWAYPTRHVVTTRADDRGAFTVQGLPPHADYLAAALDEIEAGGEEDPDFLQSLRERASRFSIDYGETKALTLDLLAR